jgi:hypothetical protein
MLNSKHIYIVLLALLLLGSCATNKDLREQQRQLRAKSVAEAVANRHFTLCIKQMYPLQGGSKVITSDFFLQLQGDTINSYLPYLGRAYSIPYGGGKGLNFIDKVRDYRSVQVKSDQVNISFTVVNDEDTYLFNLEIYDNGNANIRVIPRERDRISFDAEMDY